MGVFTQLGDYVAQLSLRSALATLAGGFAAFIVLAIAINVARQLLFANPNEPPLVFHWVPFFGSTIVYGIDPYKFFFKCREKYGDVFTFILLGRKTTVCLGTKGNEFILNAKLKDVNAEEIYSPLTTPVFGDSVVYDCPNAKLMEQKKFVKFGLTSEALRSYVPLIVGEFEDFVKRSRFFKGDRGTTNIAKAVAELTIYTASRSLQGKEVRNRFDSSFAEMYHDLDQGFSPINFMLPWAPLPHNRARDIAREKMVDTYTEIIRARRQGEEPEEKDMIWNLMDCVYKNGTPVPDREVAHMMIALLMAGQHSSSATAAWTVLNLATRPDMVAELYAEQQKVLGVEDLSKEPLSFEALQQMPMHAQVVKETLRIHAPIHSIMRQVKTPMPVPGTPYVIPTSHVLLSSPGVSARSAQHFPEPLTWEPHRWDAGHALNPRGMDEDAADDEQIDYGYGLVSKGANSPYLPFGAGRHRCIGEQFAYVQLQTLLAMFVRTFQFSNPPGREGVGDTDYSSLFSRPLASQAEAVWEKRDAAAKT